jgi:hypothetical protein
VSKAINWPENFRDAIIQEEAETLQIAVRLGRLYFDNHYWVSGDIVYIRAGHKIVREAQIVGDLRCMRLGELQASDFAMLKHPINHSQGLQQFLSETYAKPVSPETEVTLVTYQNRPFDPELLETLDDPHMMA